MPELPEVEIVKRGLEGAVMGARVARVTLNRPDLRFPIPVDLPSKIEGRVVTELMRRGKYILCFVESGDGFVLHLGMSGVVKIIPPQDEYVPVKHDHVVFALENGGSVVFNDPRRFGFLDLVGFETWRHYKSFAGMGLEPLGNDFNGPVLAAALAGRRSPIKTVLLDQKIVAGVGNIYACEALFQAGIYPMCLAGDVKGERAEALAVAIKDVLARAIESGGSSLQDYYHTDGSLGYFQHSFCVYDREGESCSRCESGIIERIIQSGRSTFLCAVCQTK